MTPVMWVVTLLVTVTIIYALTAGAYLFAGRPGLAVAFVGYVIANVGLIIDALTTR